LPVAVIAVTAAKLLGVARPAWRLLVAGVADRVLGVLVAAVVLVLLAVVGWLLRDRLPYPRRLRR
jgi:NSS family neurotransmitter:Na+ symporter